MTDHQMDIITLNESVPGLQPSNYRTHHDLLNHNFEMLPTGITRAPPSRKKSKLLQHEKMFSLVSKRAKSDSSGSFLDAYEQS